MKSAPGANTRGAKLRVQLRYQTCNERLCLPPTDLELTADDDHRIDERRGVRECGARGRLGEGARSRRIPREHARRLRRTRGPDGRAVAAHAVRVSDGADHRVVFHESAGTHAPGRGAEALVYGLGIVLTFTAVGFVLAVVFGASGLNRFAANPWLNLGVTALFVAFALSLFGVWELALPSGIVNAAARADAGRGRFVGTLLMGLAFTLTSFTCTAPFLGTLLVRGGARRLAMAARRHARVFVGVRRAVRRARAGAALAEVAAALGLVARRGEGRDGHGRTGSGDEVSVERRSGVGLGHLHARRRVGFLDS